MHSQEMILLNLLLNIPSPSCQLGLEPRHGWHRSHQCHGHLKYQISFNYQNLKLWFHIFDFCNILHHNKEFNTCWCNYRLKTSNFYPSVFFSGLSFIHLSHCCLLRQNLVFPSVITVNLLPYSHCLLKLLLWIIQHLSTLT